MSACGGTEFVRQLLEQSYAENRQFRADEDGFVEDYKLRPKRQSDTGSRQRSHRSPLWHDNARRERQFMTRREAT